MSEGDTIPLRGSADMWRSRAEAAEAEVERLTDCLETQYEINRNTARAACEARGDHFDAEDRIEELEAEVARLTQLLDDLGHRYAGVESSLHGASARIAELEAAGRELIRTQAEAERHATEDALRYVQKRWPHFYLNESDIQACIEALLGNNETNTNNQGERNA